MRGAVRWLVATAVLGGAWARAGEVTVGTGLDYSVGRYGTASETTIVSVPLLLRYSGRDWSVQAKLPYLQVSGDASVIPGMGSVDNGNPRGRGRGGSSELAQGLGDAQLAASYAAWRAAASDSGVNLTGRVKLATADRDRTLGTGENEYTAQIEGYLGLGRLTLLAGVAYTVLPSSDYVALNNAYSYNLAATHRLGEQDRVGLAWYARQRVAPTVAPQAELTLSWQHQVDRHWALQLYLLKGLEDGSPDRGAGAGLNYTF